MKEIIEGHQRVDMTIARTFAKFPQSAHCCRAGCHWCCSESVYCSEAETIHILESLTPEQIEEIKAKLPAWIEKTKSLMKHDLPDAVAYRKLNAPCVFLKDGLCSVYARRPMGCRVFFAKTNPLDCDLPNREHQKFAMFSVPVMADAMGLVFVNDYFILDHLGVHLAKILLGIHIKSGSQKKMHVSEISHNEFKEHTARAHQFKT